MKIKIEHVLIVTLNGENTIYEDGILCIQDKKLISVGTEAPTTFKPDRVIDGSGCVAMPGLVNAHCHSPMTMFRNFAGGVPLQQWMYNHIRPLQQYVTREDVETCGLLAYAEMIKGGTVAFAEMYSWADVLGELSANIGMKGLIGGCYGKDQGVVHPINRKKILEHRQELWERSDGRIEEGVLLHSPYGVTEDRLREMGEFAREAGLTLQIHVAETKKEMEEIYGQYGKTPVQLLEELGILDASVLAAHCVYLNSNDYEILTRHHVNVAHCPVSNLKLGSGIADVSSMMDAGINVCLGTDGVASNNNLNLFKEANIAALLPKGVKCDATLLPSVDILKMMTSNGYQALGIKGSGGLKQEMNADLILISMREPHFSPVVNIYDALVYSAQASDVVLVMVDGKILMENRELKTIDEEQVLEKAQKVSHKILSHS